jgi:hypothetical protein
MQHPAAGFAGPYPDRGASARIAASACSTALPITAVLVLVSGYLALFL